MATVQNQDENSDIVSLLRLAFGVKFDVSLALHIICSTSVPIRVDKNARKIS